MDKDLLIQQLREANNRNIEKRRKLAHAVRILLLDHPFSSYEYDEILKECSGS